MRKLFKLTFLLLGVFILSNCSAPKPLYYWGNYQDTYYKNMKKADEKAYDNHIATLDFILTTSAENEVRVPPGIYAEYGYIKLAEGNPTEARKFFELEMATYPESAQLMTLLLDNL
ncbi:MAG: DUF4810 domain-containing protein [Bacteroidales bacterium]|nr:DUF4810 domain-containing protein [Bacteroidales bacterium]MCF8389079.1 DUF4810 domain-containing protein [Bacteroidales bacterium]